MSAQTRIQPTDEKPRRSDSLDPMDRICRHLDDWMAASAAPAVIVSLTLPSGARIDVARGAEDVTSLTPVGVDSVVPIGSITKTITAAAILKLCTAGVLNLDVPVVRWLGSGWLNEHPHEDVVTLRHLLHHSHGLVDHAFAIDLAREAGDWATRAVTSAQILDFVARHPPLHVPETEVRYGTVGFYIAGLVIESACGIPAEGVLRELILRPAGVQQMPLAPHESSPYRIAHGYARGYIAAMLENAFRREHTAAAMVANRGEVVVDAALLPRTYTRTMGWTGGGYEGRISDVAQVVQRIFTGLLSPAEIDMMVNPSSSVVNPSSSVSTRFGLGIESRKLGGTSAIPVWCHDGHVPGYSCRAGWLPTLGVGFACVATLLPLPNGADLDELVYGVIAAIIEETGVWTGPAPDRVRIIDEHLAIVAAPDDGIGA